MRHQGIQCFAGGLTGGNRRAGLKLRQQGVNVDRQTAGKSIGNFFGLLRIDLGIFFKKFLIFFLKAGAFFPGFSHVGGYFFGHDKGFVGVPAGIFLDKFAFFDAQRSTVGGACILEIRASIADMGAELNEGRSAGGFFGGLERRVKFGDIVAVPSDRNDIPSVGLIAQGNIFRERQIGFAVDGNSIVIIDDNQIVQPEVSG